MTPNDWPLFVMFGLWAVGFLSLLTFDKETINPAGYLTCLIFVIFGCAAYVGISLGVWMVTL